MTETQTATPDGPIVVTSIANPRVTILSPREFMARLPAPTLAAIAAAAIAQPALLVWLLQCAAATEVDLDHPDTIAGVNALRAAGVLTAQQATALLA